MSKVIMTNDQLIERLRTLASRKTFYKNKYPYNLCYVHADGRTSADCVNLLKALFNGYNVYNTKAGYYQRDLTNTGDCTEAGLISQCTEVSSDFDNLKNGIAEVLYMRGHIGCFIGSTIINGKEYNVIECTPAFGNGIVYSYVDTKGTRFNYKGGQAKGTWVQHGKPTKWVSYATEGSNSGEKPKVDYSTYPILKKGSTGQYVKILQQLLLDKGYDPKGIDGIFGNNTLTAVKNFQRNNTDISGKQLEVDGCVGQKTWGSLYK